MFANVMLPAMAFIPPFALAIIVSESLIYWLILRRTHRFFKLFGVVLLVNTVSTLVGWIAWPQATTLPPPNPMAAVRIPENEAPEEKSLARQIITQKFSLACAYSILIEGVVLLVAARTFGWKRGIGALVCANVGSYFTMW